MDLIKAKYKGINTDLKEWLNENWDAWNDESPQWFTADSISRVPSHVLPADALKRMGGREERKKSIAEMKEETKKPVKDRRRRGSDLKIIPFG